MTLTALIKYEENDTEYYHSTVFRNVTQFSFLDDDTLRIWMNVDGHVKYEQIHRINLAEFTVYL